MPQRLPNQTWEEYAIANGFVANPETLQELQLMYERDAIRRVANESPRISAMSMRIPDPAITYSAPMSTEWVADNSNNYFRAGDVVTSSPRKKIEAKPMPKEVEKQLKVAREKLRVDAGNRNGHSFRGNLGSKEYDYVNLLKNKKLESMRISQLIASEIPMCLENLTNLQWRELIDVIKRSDIINEGVEMVQCICQDCGTQVPYFYGYFCVGGLYCALHVPDVTLCKICGNLRGSCARINTFDNKVIMACVSCTQKRIFCANCSESIDPSYIEVGVCARCLERDSSNSSRRHFSKGMRWVSDDMGEIVRSKRIFSCEIEALSPMRDYATKLGSKLPKEMGIGSDGSISGSGYGFEIQTPRLSGTSGEELIHRATSVVKSVKASINETCGMHIHLDGKGIIKLDRKAYPVELIQLWKSYIVFEDVLLSFLPYSRRHNDFCRPLSSSFHLTELDTADTLFDVEKILYKENTYSEIRSQKGQHYNPSRYFGVNFHSLLAHGHLEIRFHSGTINPKKILEWANLHILIMDACEKREMMPELLREAQGTSRLTEKTALLFDIIGLAQPSRQYFLSRQRKFGDKKMDEDEIVKKKSVLEELVIDEVNTPHDFSGFETLLASSPQQETQRWTTVSNATTAAGTLNLEIMRRLYNNIQDDITEENNTTN